MGELFDFAMGLAMEAGRRLEEGHGTVQRRDVEYKGWRNLVTELDLEVERYLAGQIEAAHPDHGILAEEGVSKAGRSEIRWVIDPLDGTTNYVHRHPVYCVSIAVEDAEGPLIGIVYAPRLRELFTARRGEGAYLGDRPIHVSGETDLAKALLASGFAYGKGTPEDVNLGNWATLSRLSRGLRRCGSAALDLAYVADGRYDAFWELTLNPWDVAAGALLVLEAGGRVTDCLGGGGYRDGSSIASSNGHLHEILLENLVVPPLEG
jgi:myo-inositol-1(or 4)-monophosphatase